MTFVYSTITVVEESWEKEAEGGMSSWKIRLDKQKNTDSNAPLDKKSRADQVLSRLSVLIFDMRLGSFYRLIKQNLGVSSIQNIRKAILGFRKESLSARV